MAVTRLRKTIDSKLSNGQTISKYIGTFIGNGVAGIIGLGKCAHCGPGEGFQPGPFIVVQKGVNIQCANPTCVVVN